MIDQSDIESRRHVGAGVVAMGVVVVAILVVSLGVTRSSPGHSTITKGAAEPTPHVATGPMPREDGFSPFIEWINKTYPDRVGTLSHDGEQWTVPMVNPTESDTAAIQKELTDLGLKADVVPIAISESEMNGLVKSISDAVIAQGLRFAAIVPDPAGHVTLILSEKAKDAENASITDIATQTVDQFVEKVNQDAARRLTRDAIFDIRTGPDAVPMELRNAAPPRGGSWLNLHTSTYWANCTQGWNVVNGSNRAYGITAGHCGIDPNGDPQPVVRMWGANLDGSTTANFYGQVPLGGNAFGAAPGAEANDDVQRYPIDGYTAFAHVLSGPSTVRPVIGYHANATQNIGDSICGAGFGTAQPPPAGLGLGEHCGSLSGKDVEVVMTGGHIFYFNCFYQHIYGGDSGGPVYLRSNGNAVAYGTSSVSLPFGRDQWCYETSEDELNVMNVSLLIN